MYIHGELSELPRSRTRNFELRDVVTYLIVALAVVVLLLSALKFELSLRILTGLHESV